MIGAVRIKKTLTFLLASKQLERKHGRKNESEREWEGGKMHGCHSYLDLACRPRATIGKKS